MQMYSFENMDKICKIILSYKIIYRIKETSYEKSSAISKAF